MEWAAVRKMVLARDGGRCLRCLRPADEVHHRAPRKMGGTSDPEVNFGLANLISVCRPCHSWIHSEPRQSYYAGWLVHAGMNPEEQPIVIPAPGFGEIHLTLKQDGSVEKNDAGFWF